MADRPKSSEVEAALSLSDRRVTKEQLAAAMRTREYHVRKLGGNLSTIERVEDEDEDLSAEQKH